MILSDIKNKYKNRDEIKLQMQLRVKETEKICKDLGFTTRKQFLIH